VKTVSVIIPTFNRSSFLNEAVHSIKEQTYSDIEIIIIDDCSDLAHKECLTSMMKSNRSALVIENKNRLGVSACRNIGIENATGEYLLFLDDDDILLPDFIKKNVETIERFHVDLVSCRSIAFSNDSSVSTKLIDRYNWQSHGDLSIYPMEEQPAAHIFLYHPILHSFICKKKAIGSLRFDEDLSYGEDFIFWLTLANAGKKFKKIDLIGVRYRIHPSNNSLQSSLADRIHFYKKLKEMKFKDSEVENIWHLKMSFLLLSDGQFKGIKYFLQCLRSPIILIRHVNHFVKIR
jgi:glycosyltransferase involved in cell wall biosynthesis